jgi:ATP-binding protein involved in chromosome partitioning
MTNEYDGGQDSSPAIKNSSNPQKEHNLEQEKLKGNMPLIRHKIAIISGKGGVGKSTVTVNLAMAFAMRGYIDQIGILDADIHGPCVPKMLGVHGQRIMGSPIGMFPVTAPYGIKVISMDFLLSNDDDPVIWRGPIKMKVIQQFLSDIIWGKLEFLFIDLPPGTGDEPLTVMQLIPEMDGVIIVTIPSEVSQIVVKKAVTFARQLGIPIIGIIENMSGFVCPKCGAETNIFEVGGGQKIASDLSIPFLGQIPIDSDICSSSDKGKPFITGRVDSSTIQAFVKIVGRIEQFLDQNQRIQAPASQVRTK